MEPLDSFEEVQFKKLDELESQNPCRECGFLKKLKNFFCIKSCPDYNYYFFEEELIYQTIQDHRTNLDRHSGYSRRQ